MFLLHRRNRATTPQRARRPQRAALALHVALTTLHTTAHTDGAPESFRRPTCGMTLLHVTR